jgi:single-strand DNA-binding protein
MRGVNKVILVGNATRDAERKRTESGKTVTVIGLATNRQSQGAEVSQYHRIVCWDTLAETTSAYVKKGRLLYVEGRLEYRTFIDDEGRTRGVAEIVTDDVQFLDRPPTSSDSSDLDTLDLEEIAL